MIVEVLTPGMQHRDKADLGAQMSGIVSDPAQHLGEGAKQDRIDQSLCWKAATSASAKPG